MSYLRTPNEVVRARGDWKPRDSYMFGYRFTTSQWHAIKLVGDGDLVVEGAQVDPRGLFPGKVMRDCEYAAKYGVEYSATEYLKPDTREKMGVILKLISGKFLIGCYVVRFTR